MKVALIGASGKAGSRVLKELADRGHEVTALVRNSDNVADLPGVNAVAVSGDGSDLAEKIAGHDAVISSVRFVDLDPDVLLPAIKASGVKRYLVVGGAGSLMHPDGVIEVEQPGFPDVAKPNSIRGGYLLDQLKASEGLDWTYLSPPRMFVPGERTGTFRYGKDDMLMKDGAPTSISFEDFALALVDELEKPEHTGERFTIGY